MKKTLGIIAISITLSYSAAVGAQHYDYGLDRQIQQQQRDMMQQQLQQQEMQRMHQERMLQDQNRQMEMNNLYQQRRTDEMMNNSRRCYGLIC